LGAGRNIKDCSRVQTALVTGCGAKCTGQNAKTRTARPAS
jgi:hypothetical protein